MKQCPYCHEKIKRNSSVCESCKEDLSSFKKESFIRQPAFLICLSVLLTFFLCLGGFSAFYFLALNSKLKEVTKIEKSVTITDQGIADAVDKIYNAVVVVENYRNGSLYSTGTGFVFKKEDSNGYILTNHHVIDGGTEVEVVFTDGTKAKVEVVGSDSYSDIAVLKVDEKSVLAIAELGSSEELRVGDTTFAVGAPLDAEIYSWTVTRGILSGKNRIVEVSGGRSSTVIEVLQTDAAINSGNSGGPLCNSNGEVIGVTNMKIASSSVEGMGFAIPIETAMEYASMFLDGTPISRPYLGVSMYDLENSLFRKETGIYVEAVEANSPAEKAGLKRGDIIIGFNDVEVKNTAYLKYQLYRLKVGDECTITFKRGNEEHTAKITLGSYQITT